MQCFSFHSWDGKAHKPHQLLLCIFTHKELLTITDRLWQKLKFMCLDYQFPAVLLSTVLNWSHSCLLQSTKAKAGIFCFLIHEARQATELELPGGQNVFVIKVSNTLSNYATKCLLLVKIVIMFTARSALPFPPDQDFSRIS